MLWKLIRTDKRSPRRHESVFMLKQIVNKVETSQLCLRKYSFLFKICSFLSSVNARTSKTYEIVVICKNSYLFVRNLVFCDFISDEKCLGHELSPRPDGSCWVKSEGCADGWMIWYRKMWKDDQPINFLSTSTNPNIFEIFIHLCLVVESDSDLLPPRSSVHGIGEKIV